MLKARDIHTHTHHCCTGCLLDQVSWCGKQQRAGGIVARGAKLSRCRESTGGLCCLPILLFPQTCHSKITCPKRYIVSWEAYRGERGFKYCITFYHRSLGNIPHCHLTIIVTSLLIQGSELREKEASTRKCVTEHKNIMRTNPTGDIRDLSPS